MNKLELPIGIDDYAALSALAKNERLGSYPRLKRYVKRLKAGYDQYVAEEGNVEYIDDVPIPKTTKGFLLGHYNSPPKEIRYIAEIREKTKVNTCPMCGSLHSGTLDHIMPKEDYPAFAIFALNLVPACKCNSLRSNKLTGLNHGERILHPYFDDVLRERILTAHFEDLGLAPRVSVNIILDRTNPHFEAAKFHYLNIVERNGICIYIRKIWGKLLLRPGSITTDFRHNPTSRDHLVSILERELYRIDEYRESKNNWDSVFISGLLAPALVDWLYERFNRPGRLPDSPLEP